MCVLCLLTFVQSFFSPTIVSVVRSCLVLLVWLVCDLNKPLKNKNDIFLVVWPFFQSLNYWNETENKNVERMHNKTPTKNKMSLFFYLHNILIQNLYMWRIMFFRSNKKKKYDEQQITAATTVFMASAHTINCGIHFKLS